MLDHMNIEEMIWLCDSLQQLRRHSKGVFCEQMSSDGSPMEERLPDHGRASLVVYGERQMHFWASCINGEVAFKPYQELPAALELKAWAVKN
ncbi:hypothetical protein Acr_28g0008910 [Actinidia rufa]|uniref:Uncharacterized protein n=1 Tax=Actinidia rufa TaxID=165716 RepID=A0A7J0HAT0_9ERIC|nr:hypothetical protein Acr_28g0008910 [Actinidia rufa]